MRPAVLLLLLLVPFAANASLKVTIEGSVHMVDTALTPFFSGGEAALLGFTIDTDTPCSPGSPTGADCVTEGQYPNALSEVRIILPGIEADPLEETLLVSSNITIQNPDLRMVGDIVATLNHIVGGAYAVTAFSFVDSNPSHASDISLLGLEDLQPTPGSSFVQFEFAPLFEGGLAHLSVEVSSIVVTPDPPPVPSVNPVGIGLILSLLILVGCRRLTKSAIHELERSGSA